MPDRIADFARTNDYPSPGPDFGGGRPLWRIRLRCLVTTAPAGLQVMGYGSYTSYQYPGGLDLTAISNVPKDTL